MTSSLQYAKPQRTWILCSKICKGWCNLWLKNNFFDKFNGLSKKIITFADIKTKKYSVAPVRSGDSSNNSENRDSFFCQWRAIIPDGINTSGDITSGKLKSRWITKTGSPQIFLTRSFHHIIGATTFFLKMKNEQWKIIKYDLAYLANKNTHKT